MKAVELDNLCRIVIPVAYRNELKIDKGSPLTMTMEKGAIVIRPADESCRICGSKVAKNAPLPLCRACIVRAKNA